MIFIVTMQLYLREMITRMPVLYVGGNNCPWDVPKDCCRSQSAWSVLIVAIIIHLLLYTAQVLIRFDEKWEEIFSGMFI